MLLTCRSTVFSATNSWLAMAWLVAPVATSRSTCSSRSVSHAPSSGLPVGECLQPGELGCGAELGEHGPGGLQLHGRGLLVPQRPAAEPDQHPHPRRLIGRLQLLPGLPGAAQRDHGGAGVALGQQHRPRAWSATARSAGVS